MPKNKIEDLRNLLFDTMERLLDEDNPLEIQRAQTIANVGKVIVETAKAETAFMKEIGGLGSGFIPVEPNELDDKLAAKRLRSANGDSLS